MDVIKVTYPPPVLDQLFPVYFVEPRYPDELALGVDQAVSQLLVFAAHGLEHVLGTRCERVGQTEQSGRLRAVAVDTSRGPPILLVRKLLRKPQRRELAGEAVYVRL